VLIAGAGYIADYHLAILRELPDVEVAGACDPHPERLAALAERYPRRSYTGRRKS